LQEGEEDRNVTRGCWPGMGAVESPGELILRQVKPDGKAGATMPFHFTDGEALGAGPPWCHPPQRPLTPVGAIGHSHDQVGSRSTLAAGPPEWIKFV
jgi:hypothetical protein